MIAVRRRPAFDHWIVAPLICLALIAFLLFGPVRWGTPLAYSVALAYIAYTFAVALKDFDKALALVVFYLPLQVTFSASGILNIQSGFVLVLVLAAAWVCRSAAGKEVRPETGPSTFILGTLAILLGLSCLRGEFNPQMAKRPAYVLAYLLLELMVRSHFRSRAALVRAWSAFRLGAWVVLVAGVALYALQFFMELGAYKELLRTRLVPVFVGNHAAEAFRFAWSAFLGSGARAISLFLEPHDLAYYLATVIPFAFVMVVRERRGVRHSIRNHMLLWLAVAAMLASMTRASWVACFIVVPFLLWRGRDIALLASLYAGAAAGIAFALGLAVSTGLAGSQFSARLGSVFDSSEFSNYHRQITWERGLHNIRENPILGTAKIEYSDVERQMFGDELIAAVGQGGTHNTYLDFAQQLGFPGLSLLVALGVHMFRSARSAVKRLPNTWIAHCFTGVVLWFAVHNMFDSCFFSPKPALCFWFLAGLSAAEIRLVRSEQRAVAQRIPQPHPAPRIPHRGAAATA